MYVVWMVFIKSLLVGSYMLKPINIHLPFTVKINQLVS